MQPSNLDCKWNNFAKKKNNTILTFQAASCGCCCFGQLYVVAPTRFPPNPKYDCLVCMCAYINNYVYKYIYICHDFMAKMVVCLVNKQDHFWATKKTNKTTACPSRMGCILVSQTQWHEKTWLKRMAPSCLSNYYIEDVGELGLVPWWRMVNLCHLNLPAIFSDTFRNCMDFSTSHQKKNASYQSQAA